MRGDGDKDERRASASAELDRVGMQRQCATATRTSSPAASASGSAIARALVLRAEALICDEPVSALDVSIQAQILNLLAELRAELGIAMLFISHDLSVVASLCDRTAVMCAGKIVETGDSLTLSRQGRHPYTVILHDSVPTMGAHEEVASRLEADRPHRRSRRPQPARLPLRRALPAAHRRVRRARARAFRSRGRTRGGLFPPRPDRAPGNSGRDRRLRHQLVQGNQGGVEE